MNMKTLFIAGAFALTPVLATAADGHMDMSKMQAHMQTMEAEMTQIAAIKDPSARKAAMQKHMQGMMSMMAGMKGMDHAKGMGGSGDQQIAYLNERVDMLEAMVNQMVQSRAVSYGIYPDSLSAQLSDEEYKEK
jgi:hypothetical protein